MMRARRLWTCVALLAMVTAGGGMAGQASAGPLGSLDGGSSGPGGPGGGAVTDTYMTLRLEFPGNVPTARTYRVQAVPSGDVCVSHQNTVDYQQTVPANAAGVTRQDTLAYLRDANPFNTCAWTPSAGTWRLTLTTPAGSEGWNILMVASRGTTSSAVNPEGETDLAMTTRSGTTVGVKVK
ncbi:hypothetical protein [Gordonia insulae]|uniref:Secreted protein n=1 Tax=Gordonia insulae TaxID=2420509 RepID=A0A3G8JPT5_9ACTN|nr:hypothetical protein [Gordonia insulae]AZG46988.1 hypothetical protein D7316_03593 [Gordonia insulae]